MWGDYMHNTVLLSIHHKTICYQTNIEVLAVSLHVERYAISREHRTPYYADVSCARSLVNIVSIPYLMKHSNLALDR